MDPVEISLNDIGIGTVRVDGHNLAATVRKIEIVAEAGRLTDVVLYLIPERLRVKLPAAVSTRIAELPIAEDKNVDVTSVGVEQRYRAWSRDQAEIPHG